MNNIETLKGLLILGFDPQEPGVPNFDALMTLYDVDNLECWLRAVGSDTKGAANLMFPKQKGGRRAATITLMAYGTYKIHAIKARLDGDIQVAMLHEARLDELYFRLPEWARW